MLGLHLRDPEAPVSALSHSRVRFSVSVHLFLALDPFDSVVDWGAVNRTSDFTEISRKLDFVQSGIPLWAC